MAAPTTVGALAALRRDVLRSGVAATEAPVEASAYVLEITFVHLAGTWSTGPETLALVVPVVAVAGYCEFRATLRDRHGRVFLEKTVSSRKEAHATPVASPASAAADLLGFAVSEAIEELLPLLVPAVETWWRARDLPPRREPALNPLPAPRSNTDR